MILPLPFSGLSSGNPFILAVVFLVLCNLLVSSFQLFSVISSLSFGFLTIFQPIFLGTMSMLFQGRQTQVHVSLPLQPLLDFQYLSLEPVILFGFVVLLGITNTKDVRYSSAIALQFVILHSCSFLTILEE